MRKQVALIARWHAKTTDLATRLLALSCFDHNRLAQGRNAIEDDVFSFQSLDLELTVDLIDTLHEYAFTLRKLIERAGVVDDARSLRPHNSMVEAVIGAGGTDERRVEPCQESLWWILGRFVHSKHVMVLGGDTSQLRVYHDGKTREYPDGRCFVEVASERDPQATAHVVHVPSLVGCFTFSSMEMRIREVVQENSM